MSRSRSPSLISLVLLAGLTCGGCGDDTCGPATASPNGLQLGDGVTSIHYGGMVAGANNDCPDASAPAGVTSLTIRGVQVDPSTGSDTKRADFCIGRPDLLSTDLALGDDVDGSPVRIVDLTGTGSDGCEYEMDQTQPPTGSLHAQGICGNGSDSRGFALDVEGAVSLTRTCAGVVDTAHFQLTGTIAVEAQ